MNPLHRIKLFLKRALPAPLVDFILRTKWEKMKPIDLDRLALIRSKDTGFLAQAGQLEHGLLPQLGLNDELLYQMPVELQARAGEGLRFWQYPNQFSKYLVLLSRLKISSYLEIGVRHGGTFLITVEYLQKFQSLQKALGVDLGYAPSVVEYAKRHSHVHFFQADSQSERFKDRLVEEGFFDLVLIDGNHGEVECRNDYLAVKDRCGVMVLHDISSVICPGVQKLWAEIKTQADMYTCVEFIEQYSSVQQRTGQSFFGIGVAIKKEYLNQKGISLQ